jgi:FkbM family methyltransferase
MKARELAYLLGFRPPLRRYGWKIERFHLPRDGAVEYAAWLHPAERPKVIRQEHVDALRAFLRPGDVAVDIGAHTGDTAIPMALAVGPAGRVLALEPNPYVFPILERNATLNPAKTAIVPLNFAATPEAGTFRFEYSDSGYCNGGQHQGISRWRHGHAFPVEVRGEHLERYLTTHYPELLPAIRYLKIDAEGNDLAVLESLTSLIVARRPFVRAEVYRHTGRADRTRLHALLTRLGYDIRRLVDDTQYFGERLSANDMTQPAQFDVFCVPLEADLSR